ncbi:MAG: nicotinamide-nucleotide amidohydrolase family protein [Mycoplasmataceae bacterium]|nr:nicotinamide-nucleotide amidohydrolase family protein [Mycoplasmataceae bacterium]
MTFAAVESFTGGMFSSKIVSIPGASTFFKGSLIAYNNEIKKKLGVNISNGVINYDVAKELALKGKEYFDVDYCFSFTGNAGPIPMESKEIGLVFIALNDQVFELKLKGTREEIREQSVQFAFNMFQKLLKN